MTIPACEPVNEIASRPRSLIAIDSSAIEIRSPAVSSMSSSRACGGSRSAGELDSSSVVSPIAETTTQTSLPASAACDDARATCLIRSASPTDVPPYFWTTSATGER